MDVELIRENDDGSADYNVKTIPEHWIKERRKKVSDGTYVS